MAKLADLPAMFMKFPPLIPRVGTREILRGLTLNGKGILNLVAQALPDRFGGHRVDISPFIFARFKMIVVTRA
ncbi:hypothetical protein ACIQZO_00455 [Streptomyces sp. NPDC097617]|uniref:hypothetical protein n=1 Tax=Streptomyces sp. NPDC097617 TaxID=3366091 RepID=UPI00380523B6